MVATSITQVPDKTNHEDFPLQSNRQERIVNLVLTIKKLFRNFLLFSVQMTVESLCQQNARKPGGLHMKRPGMLGF